MKYCIKCNKPIDEDKDKSAMIITKLGRKILEMECFHFECWREFVEGGVLEGRIKEESSLI